MSTDRRPGVTFSSLISQIQKAKSALNNVETRILTADGRELVEKRDENETVGFTDQKQVSVRSWGFIPDFRPDLQMAKITSGLYLGGQDPAHEVDLLESHQISHMLNLATNVDNKFPARFVYLKVDLFDLPSANIMQFFPKCLDFIVKAISGGGRVFCHCNAGVSRSASVVIAYLMKYRNMTLREAFEHVRAARPVIQPNSGFLDQLKMFETEILLERDRIYGGGGAS